MRLPLRARCVWAPARRRRGLLPRLGLCRFGLLGRRLVKHLVFVPRRLPREEGEGHGGHAEVVEPADAGAMSGIMSAGTTT